MTTSTATRTHSLGDLVIPNPEFFGRVSGVVYRITKVPNGAREVNYIAMPKDNPTGRGIRARAEAMLPWTGGDSTRPVVTLMPYVSAPDAGTVVRVTGHPKIANGALFVVMGTSQRGNGAKIVALGGDNGRYWPHMPLSNLTVVPLGNIVVG